MKDENEDPLEGVEGGEEIGHDDRLLVDEEEAEGPGEAEQEEQRDGPQGPGSGEGGREGGDIKDPLVVMLPLLASVGLDALCRGLPK